MNPKTACLKRREEEKTSTGVPNMPMGIDPSRCQDIKMLMVIFDFEIFCKI